MDNSGYMNFTLLGIPYDRFSFLRNITALQIYLYWLIQDKDFLKLYKIQLNHRSSVESHLQILQLPSLKCQGKIQRLYIIFISIKINKYIYIYC